MRKQANRLLKRMLPPRLFNLLSYFIRPDKTVIVYGDISYNTDGLTTTHNADFMKDALFREAYSLGKATGSWLTSEPMWRTYVNCWAAWHARMAG
jgi:hypothetical protein